MTSGFPQRGTKYWSTQLRSSSQGIWVENLCSPFMWNKTIMRHENLWTRLRISRTTDSVSSELESCELVKDIWKLNFAWMGLPLVQSTFYLRVVNILQLFRLGNHISLFISLLMSKGSRGDRKLSKTSTMTHIKVSKTQIWMPEVLPKPRACVFLLNQTAQLCET